MRIACHYLIINEDVAIEQKFLGIIMEKGLNFQSHTKSIIKVANQKLSALIRAVYHWFQQKD